RDLPRRHHHRKTSRLPRSNRPAPLRGGIGARSGSPKAWRMMSSNAKTIASHQLPATPLDPELAAKRAEKIKVSMISLRGCSGGPLSFLDVDERLLALLDKIPIHRSSLTDIKRITQRCAIGFIEGGVANEENIETHQHFREDCDVPISVAPARSGAVSP